MITWYQRRQLPRHGASDDGSSELPNVKDWRQSDRQHRTTPDFRNVRAGLVMMVTTAVVDAYR